MWLEGHFIIKSLMKCTKTLNKSQPLESFVRTAFFLMGTVSVPYGGMFQTFRCLRRFQYCTFKLTYIL